MTVKIHPSVDNGVKAGTPGFAGGTLTCKCTSDPVKVEIKSDVLFNTSAVVRSAGGRKAPCFR